MKRRDGLIGLGGMAATPALAQVGAPSAAPPPAATPPVSAPPAAAAAASSLAAPTPTVTGAAPATAAPTVAPPTPAPTGPPPLTPGAVRVAIRTAHGVILIDLFRDKAPITVANFLRYVDQRFYDKASFYRASHPGDDPNWGALQGGLQNTTAAPLKPIAHESTLKTGIKHLNGTLSMTRNAPGTATSDFFIVLGDQEFFDAKPGQPGYAAFGRVVSGLDVVKKINFFPRSRTAGVGFMKGEMLSTPVPFGTVRRVSA